MTNKELAEEEEKALKEKEEKDLLVEDTQDKKEEETNNKELPKEEEKKTEEIKEEKIIENPNSIELLDYLLTFLDSKEELMVDMDHIKIPLAAACTIFYPFMIFSLRAFFKNLGNIINIILPRL